MDGLPAGVRDPAHRIERSCDGCGQIDTHPRHIHLGLGATITTRHFDCCDTAGCPADGVCGTVMVTTLRRRGDDLTAWLEGRMAALGGELTAWLKAGAPHMGGASGLDQARVTDFLGVVTGYAASTTTPFLATLTNPFTGASGGTNGGHIRLITTVTPSNSVTPGSELASSGSYVAGVGISYNTGNSGSFGAPTYGTSSGSATTGVTLSQNGMPATTVGGVEMWDSKGGQGGSPPYFTSALRWAWGTLASNVTTNSGDTLSFGAGAIVETLTA